MEPDPHDEYYARKQAHRAEMFGWVGQRRAPGDSAPRKSLIVVAVLFVAAGSAVAGWFGLLR